MRSIISWNVNGLQAVC